MNERHRETLVIISPGFPSNESDSTCLPAIQTFVKAVNRNFPALKVVVVSLQYPYRIDRYIWNNNVVMSLNGKRTPKLFRFWLWMKTYFQLEKISRENRLVGVLSLWCMETALVGKFFSKRKKVKHFIWIQGQDAKKENRFIWWIKPKADQLIALSEFLVLTFKNNHDITPHYIIPNGIDSSEYKKSGAVKTLDVVAVGSLIPLKQYSVFVKVVEELVKSKPDLKAVLAGAGPEEKKLRRQIAEARLDQNILMTGEVPHEKVIEMMQQSKIFLHPSSYEGYSTVCLEALYAGCHVVSFVAAENRRIEHWHIVNDTQQMINRCSDLLANTADVKPVLVHDMNESARSMMKLFNYFDTTE